MKRIIFYSLFLLLLCFSASASHLVYVENATNFTLVNSWFDGANANDTDWNTYGYNGAMIPYDFYAYADYTARAGFMNFLWNVKDGKGIDNITSASCTGLRFEFHGFASGSGNCIGRSYWNCWNGTAFVNLRDTGNGAEDTCWHFMYEEGLWQNISDGTSISSITPSNSSSLSVGVNCTLTPVDGSVSSVNVTLNDVSYSNVDSCNATFTLPGEGLFNGSITTTDSYGVSNTTAFTVNVSGLLAPPLCVDDFSMPALNLGITIAILFGLTAMLVGKKEHLGSWLTISIFILVMAFVIWAMNNWNALC